MGLEQNLKLWEPLSKNIYQLRMLTRHYQTLQEFKNQRHAILHSRIVDKFTLKHLDRGSGPQVNQALRQTTERDQRSNC